MKKIITLLFFLFAFFIFPASKVKAQAGGKCECVIVTDTRAPTCGPNNRAGAPKCNEGYFATCSQQPIGSNLTNLSCGDCKCEKGTTNGGEDCGGEGENCCPTNIIKDRCGTGLECDASNSGGGIAIGTCIRIIPDDEQRQIEICDNIPEGPNRDKCFECMISKEGNKVWTGLGCINTSPTELITQILQIAVGLGGGIAFLMLIYGGFLLTTSSGNPEATDNAKQIITGTITGLLVIIFSVVILNLIGVQILKIPGL